MPMTMAKGTAAGPMATTSGMTPIMAPPAGVMQEPGLMMEPQVPLGGGGMAVGNAPRASAYNGGYVGNQGGYGGVYDPRSGPVQGAYGPRYGPGRVGCCGGWW
jgi:hypothetical protein